MPGADGWAGLGVLACGARSNFTSRNSCVGLESTVIASLTAAMETTGR